VKPAPPSFEPGWLIDHAGGAWSGPSPRCSCGTPGCSGDGPLRDVDWDAALAVGGKLDLEGSLGAEPPSEPSRPLSATTPDAPAGAQRTRRRASRRVMRA
jgi:hypothetical protein